jgi:uncharacterized protein (TIGR02444 family)
MGDLWDFAVGHYGRAGVAEACLDIQDRWGVDIPLLLYGGWMGTRGYALSQRDVDQVDAAVRDWREHVVRPLRQIRVDMKSGRYPMPSEARDALRGQVKSAELQSERLQLQSLERDCAEIGVSGQSPDDAVVANVLAIIALFAGPASDPASRPAVRCLIAAMTAGRTP